MTRSVERAFAALLLLATASFVVPSFAQDQDRTSRGMMGNDESSRDMMGRGRMMGNGGMMRGMMGRGLGDGCAGMMGGMGPEQRPNQQWRRHSAPNPESDQG